MCYFHLDPPADCCLTPALSAVVIGHWAQDGALHAESLCNGGHHNVFPYKHDRETLLRSLISTFSFDGQTVIDGITDSGIACIYSTFYKVSKLLYV